MRRVAEIVSDDHAGLRAARRAVLGAATWQRYRFHLARNDPSRADPRDPHVHRRRAAGRLDRRLSGRGRNRPGRAGHAYRDTAPKLAARLEENVPEGPAVFSLPAHHRRRPRISNPMERSVQQEFERRTSKVRVFPDEESLQRLVSTVLVGIDAKWAADTKMP